MARLCAGACQMTFRSRKLEESMLRRVLPGFYCVRVYTATISGEGEGLDFAGRDQKEYMARTPLFWLGKSPDVLLTSIATEPENIRVV